jgi:hypothetical protein
MSLSLTTRYNFSKRYYLLQQSACSNFFTYTLKHFLAALENYVTALRRNFGIPLPVGAASYPGRTVFFSTTSLRKPSNSYISSFLIFPESSSINN